MTYQVDYYDGPVWRWFSLSYASYFVMPRSVLQSMPAEWQKRFVSLMEEMHDVLDYGDALNYTVTCRVGNKFVRDEFANYKHFDHDLIKYKGALA